MNEEQDIYSFWSIRAVSHAYHHFPRYTLVYLYSGLLHLRNQCGEALSIVRGDCAFIGRDSYSHLYAEPEVDAPCQMLYFSFPRHFLCEFYQTLDSSFRKHTMEALPALHLLSACPGIESFFQSLVPYLHRKQPLPEALLQLKTIEAAYTLINMDKRYAANLFDFAGKCGMDVFDLLKPWVERGIVWKEFSVELDNKLN